MKKLINRPEDVVKEALAGMQAAHPDLLRVDIEQQIIVRKDAPKQGKVGVISGGGSGHEPMHGGFVGMGMLDAACPGAVFTSPVPDQMLAIPVIEDLGLKSGEQVLALVNGMGGTPLIELYIVFDALHRILHGKQITIARSLVGNYITSLEMAGCSITLVRLNDEIMKYWDAPVHTPALRWGV